MGSVIGVVNMCPISVQVKAISLCVGIGVPSESASPAAVGVFVDHTAPVLR
jgi:hypothetical protein